MPQEVKRFTYSLSGRETSFRYKDDEGVVILFEDERGYRTIETEIHNVSCKFRVDHIKEEWLEWFVLDWARQCKENIEHGMRIARNEVNDCIDKFFHSLNRRI